MTSRPSRRGTSCFVKTQYRNESEGTLIIKRPTHRISYVLSVSHASIESTSVFFEDADEEDVQLSPGASIHDIVLVAPWAEFSGSALAKKGCRLASYWKMQASTIGIGAFTNSTLRRKLSDGSVFKVEPADWKSKSEVFGVVSHWRSYEKQGCNKFLSSS